MNHVMRPSIVSDLKGNYGPEIHFDPTPCENWPNGVWMCGIPDGDHFEGATPNDAMYAWQEDAAHNSTPAGSNSTAQSQVKMSRYGTKDVSGIGCAPRQFCGTQEFGALYVCSLDHARHLGTCGYWYLVTTGSMAHTAFAEREHFMAWLEDRGLKLKGEMPKHEQLAGVHIEGKYRTSMHMSYDAFYSIEGKRIRTLCNGEYTLGIIAQDPDGIYNVHTLNPNMRDRIVFDYAESRALVG